MNVWNVCRDEKSGPFAERWPLWRFINSLQFLDGPTLRRLKWLKKRAHPRFFASRIVALQTDAFPKRAKKAQLLLIQFWPSLSLRSQLLCLAKEGPELD